MGLSREAVLYSYKLLVAFDYFMLKNVEPKKHKIRPMSLRLVTHGTNGENLLHR